MLSALNLVNTLVVVTVTVRGVVVFVAVIVVDGRVVLNVMAVKTVSTELIIVILMVVDGVVVTLNTAVGVAVIVACGPAIMLKVLIHAKVRPSMMIM